MLSARETAAAIRRHLSGDMTVAELADWAHDQALKQDATDWYEPSDEAKVAAAVGRLMMMEEGEQFAIEKAELEELARFLETQPQARAEGSAPHPAPAFRAVFAGSSLPPAEVLRVCHKRLDRDEWKPDGKPLRLAYAYDETRGRYMVSNTLSDTPFETRLPAYGHWKGEGRVFKLGKAALTAEALQPDPSRGRPSLLVLSVPQEAGEKHAKSAAEATRFAGLLLDLFEELEAVRCAYGPNLLDLDLGTRREVPAGARLLILGKDDPLARGMRTTPPEGMKVVDLTTASLLVTSLPVKKTP